VSLRHPRLVDADLATREERKRRTRRALLDAALALMGEGRSFTSLGLREVTRQAGVVPTSFYRHFHDLDELGLALVEEGGRTLRHLLREVRQAGLTPADTIRRSVRVYREYVEAHRLHFRFLAGERAGGSGPIRNAIRREVGYFVQEMADDLRQLHVLPELTTPALQMVCGLVVNTMLNAAIDILDLPPDDPHREAELMETFLRQLRVVFLGGMQWKEPPRST
jgi:AcrR family transcriptional regulator